MIEQVIVNGLLAGVMWGFVGFGFSIIYSTTRTLHIAYAASLTAGAFVGIYMTHISGLPLLLCFLGAMVAAVFIGCVSEIFFYRILRSSGASGLVIFLVSLGILVVSENLISIVFGSETLLSGKHAYLGVIDIFETKVSKVRFFFAIIVTVLFVLSWMFIRVTKIGKQMKAVADNLDLAIVVGIDSTNIMVLSMIFGSAIAGAAGLLIALESSATLSMGFTVFLIGVTSAIISGVDFPPGAMLGGLIVGISQHLVTWFVSPVWDEGIVFIVLLLILFIRPQGLFGRPLRRATI